MKMTDAAACELLDSPFGRRVFHALDRLGWMVVQQDAGLGCGSDGWPVPLGTRAKWPAWCNDEFAAYRLRRSKLRLVEKPDGPDR
jgi:hypothetical protein